MIKTLRQAAFLRLTLFLVLGILIQTQINLFPYWIYGVLSALVIFFLAQLPKNARSYRWRWLFGAGLFLLCVSVAGIISYVKWNQSEWTAGEKMQSYRVQLLDYPVRKPQTWMCKVKTGDRMAVIYIPVDSASSSLSLADWLLINARFEKTDLMYLRKQGIAARAFVAKSNWKKLEDTPEQGFNLRFHSLKYRKNTLSRLKQVLPDENSFAIAAAISCGYAIDIDQDLRQIFAATGTAHLLAISGLHFAIIYGMLNFLFSFLGYSQRGRIIRQSVILPLLWIYAFFTGLPPSVIRAATMITLWGVGNAFFFRAFTINTLGAAAFFILLYNPLYLFDIGFQLSFSAVFAILLINPYLTSLYQSRNPALKYVWDLSCTSTSAQLGTAPLSIYYFNQFPILYLVANVFAIPLSGILLLMIPVSLLVSFFFGNHPELLFPLRKLMQVFIDVLVVLAEVPNGVITNINLTVKDSFLMTLGIIFSFLLLTKKRMIYLCLLLILVALQVFYYLCSQ
jgi:competence protein ComEC